MFEKLPDRSSQEPVLGIKKISPEDQGYLKNQQEVTENSDNEVFGKEIVSTYKLLTMLLINHESHSAPDAEMESLQKKIAKFGKKLENVFKTKDPHTLRAAENYLLRGVTYSDNALRLAREFIGIKDDEEDFMEASDRSRFMMDATGKETALSDILAKRIKASNALPPDLLGSLVLGNKTGLSVLEQQLHEKYLPEIINNFKLEIPAFLEQYGISADQAAKALTRIDTLAVHVVDSLVARLESMGGYYSHHDNQVSVDASLVSERRKQPLREVLVHEFFHAISGRLVYKENTKTTIFVDTEDGEVEEQKTGSVETHYTSGRVGLSFRVPNFEAYLFDGNKERGKDRFEWMNEAVTEQLALEFVSHIGGGTPSGGYHKEREALKLLCEKSNPKISFQLFVEAYFENYEPIENGETIPKWRALREAINKSEGSKFLVEKDEQMKS